MTELLIIMWFVATEILKGYGTKRLSPRCAFKLFIFEAYDTVSWSFIGIMLSYFNFSEKLVTLIMKCVTTTSFYLLINGVAQGYFNGHRDLKQSDPLSPYMHFCAMYGDLEHETRGDGIFC